MTFGFEIGSNLEIFNFDLILAICRVATGHRTCILIFCNQTGAYISQASNQQKHQSIHVVDWRCVSWFIAIYGWRGEISAGESWFCFLPCQDWSVLQPGGNAPGDRVGVLSCWDISLLLLAWDFSGIDLLITADLGKRKWNFWHLQLWCSKTLIGTRKQKSNQIWGVPKNKLA